MRAAVIQTTSSDDPSANLSMVQALLREAQGKGAEMAFLPEVVNCVSMDRRHQADVLRVETEDLFLAGMRASARELGLWISVGSLALRSDPPESRFANRSFMIDPDGEIVGRYDKMHMFDVQVNARETYRESKGYAPGREAVVCRTPFATVGLSICYDIRFPYLYRALAKAGADILTVPAAFSPATGPAHWQPLLQARAIENGCFVVAAAQTGIHTSGVGRARETHGHGMVVSPWGEVVLDAGKLPGVYTVDLDLERVADARRKIPSLMHDQDFVGPR